MNKFISYYELLGMIKEGEMPKKVIYKGIEYFWSTERYSTPTGTFLSDIDEIKMFDKCIEIPNDDFENIEEIYFSVYEYGRLEETALKKIENKFNELINNQKKIINILKEK